MLPAAVLGFIVGWAVGVWLGWEPFFTAVGVLLLAQVVVDACWVSRYGAATPAASAYSRSSAVGGVP
jgi:hypothetical protein